MRRQVRKKNVNRVIKIDEDEIHSYLDGVVKETTSKNVCSLLPASAKHTPEDTETPVFIGQCYGANKIYFVFSA